jgi:predicted MPP superfamily phosphohydrolase
MHDSRSYLQSLSFLLVLLALSPITQVRGADQTWTNRFSIVAGPVLQCPTESTMRITWVTERSATGLVEFGPTGGELRTAFSSHHGLVDANQRLHSVALDNLTPGTDYRYRVVSREIVNLGAYKVEFGETATNEFQSFRTLDSRKTEYSFVVLNDIHDQAATIPELLTVAGSQPYEFVILNGDIVSHTDDEKPVLSILDQAAKSFASSIPMFWVRGNHETRGSFARRLPEYIGLPRQRYYYSFDHGPVHFIVLDAGEDKIDSHREYYGLVDFARYRREQGEWLKAHVKTDAFQAAKYRIVICHMPFPSKVAADPNRYSEKGVFVGMADAYEQFGETLETAGIDMMLSGHMHFASLILAEPPRHSYPIVQGGGNKGNSRTVTRVNVTSDGLEAVILRADGSRAAACRVPPRIKR